MTDGEIREVCVHVHVLLPPYLLGLAQHQKCYEHLDPAGSIPSVHRDAQLEDHAFQCSDR